MKAAAEEIGRELAVLQARDTREEVLQLCQLENQLQQLEMANVKQANDIANSLPREIWFTRNLENFAAQGKYFGGISVEGGDAMKAELQQEIARLEEREKETLSEMEIRRMRDLEARLTAAKRMTEEQAAIASAAARTMREAEEKYNTISEASRITAGSIRGSISYYPRGNHAPPGITTRRTRHFIRI